MLGKQKTKLTCSWPEENEVHDSQWLMMMNNA